MRRAILVLPFLVGGLLQGGDLDVFLSASFLGPKKNMVSETVDQYGQRHGRSAMLSTDFRQMGAGISYAFLDFGPWRLKGDLEANFSYSDPGCHLFYTKQVSPTLEEYIDVSAKVKSYSINPGLSVVYRSTGFGEYGLSYEQHFQTLRCHWSGGRWEHSSPIEPTWEERKISLSDPFLSAHATFVQQYQDFGFLARISYGVNLRSAKGVNDFTDAQYARLDKDLLELLRPMQEVKLSAGVRF